MAPLLFVSQSMSVTVCVGEWSRRPWTSVNFIHWRQVASVLVSRQRWSCIGRWQLQWLHSAAKQSVTAATSHHQQWVSSAAAAPNTPLLQWTYVRTVHWMQQQWVVVVVAWRHLSIQSTMSDWLITAQLKLTSNARNLPYVVFISVFLISFSRTLTVVQKNDDVYILTVVREQCDHCCTDLSLCVECQ